MDDFFNSILDLIILASGCISCVISAVIIILLILGEAETGCSIPWSILLGVGGGGLVRWSLKSILVKK